MMRSSGPVRPAQAIEKLCLLAKSCHIFLLTAAIFSSALLILTPASAQTATSNFNIPAQSLSSALLTFSNQSGISVALPHDLAAGLTSKPLTGTFPSGDALKKLLDGTGLGFEFIDPTTVKIESVQPGRRSEAPKRATAAPRQDQVTENAVEEIVVTAQKRDERLQSVPVPATVLNATTLTDNNQVLLREYYQSVPGLNVMPDIEDNLSLSIRGISTGGFTAPTVGLVVDDISFTASTLNSGNGLPDIDPGDLARIEVLRGPQGTLYGANSMGGLLKYVTKDPSPDRLTARVEAGTSDIYNAAQPGFVLRGSANIPLTDSAAVRVSGFRRQDGGYINNPGLNLQGVNETEAYGGRISGLWRPNDTTTLKLSALYQHNTSGALTEVRKEPGLGPWDQDYIAGLRGISRTFQAYSADVTTQLGGFDLTSVTGYNINHDFAPFDWTTYFASLTHDGIPGTGFNGFGVTGTPLYTIQDQKKFSQEFRVSGPITSHIDLLIGAYYRNEHNLVHQDSFGSNQATGQVLGQLWDSFGLETFQEYAAFADLTYKFNEEADVQFGLRESRTMEGTDSSQTGPLTLILAGSLPPFIVPKTTTSGDALTYLFTPRYRFSTNVMAYARLASGYRPAIPNQSGVGIPSSAQSDKTNNYEVGLKGDFFNHRFHIDASIYYIDWQNIQISLVIPTSSIGYVGNGSGAKSEGVELSVGARPWAGFSATGWVSYDDAVLTRDLPATSTAIGRAGDPLPNTSRLSGYLSLEQKFPLYGEATGFVGADFSFVGNRQGVFTSTSARQDLPAYTKTDLRAGISYGSWTVNAYVNNVANVRGLLDGGIGYIQLDAYVYIQPRTAGINVVKTF